MTAYLILCVISTTTLIGFQQEDTVATLKGKTTRDYYCKVTDKIVIVP